MLVLWKNDGWRLVNCPTFNVGASLSCPFAGSPGASVESSVGISALSSANAKVSGGGPGRPCALGGGVALWSAGRRA